jgi:pantetheine-phosphate adenylyltransferase
MKIEFASSAQRETANVPNEIVKFVELKYNEKHRSFHTCDHVNKILKRIEESGTSVKNTRILVWVALFHDIVYEPWVKRSSRNGESISDEDVSAELFELTYKELFIHSMFGLGLSVDEIEEVKKIIRQTAGHTGTSVLEMMFNTYDTEILSASTLSELIEYEHQIFKEYSFNRIDLYIRYRCEFLEKYSVKHPLLSQLAEYVKSRPYKIAFYPGTFNPFHKGHLDVLEKAEKIFDKVVIIQGHNPDKNDQNLSNLYSIKSLGNREFVEMWGNIIEQVFSPNNPISKYNPVMIRGVRNSHDLLYEDTYIKFCKEIQNNLQAILILCDHSLSHISSSSLRSLNSMKSLDIYEKYIVR